MLAMIWTMATGSFTLTNLVLGFALGYFVLLVGRRTTIRSRYFTKVPQVCGFVLFYLRELVLANLRVAYDIVTPTHHMKPGVLAVPLDAESDTEITLLANLLTLTPGSLALDVSADRRWLYVHFMYIDNRDVEAVRRRVKERLEQRVLKVLR
jgi:multicomponent Na+:H+ antiporter subunit E